ncbi:MAG: NAD(P)H-quinone oxidoreductase subunit [Bacteroidetes bacterium]|nr:NAD(P)H-quinone oxidoreductase subunit [Bacteroidota bacterium]
MNSRIVERLNAFSRESIEGTDEYRGDLTVTVRRADIARVATFLKNDPELSFEQIIDVIGVDMYRPDFRFEVVYVLYSLKNRKHLRLKVRVEEDHPVVPSVTGVWAGANWAEREAYDMIGIKFEGHPDLRRLYMPDEFEYYPLRKDFPLMGIPDSLPLPRR